MPANISELRRKILIPCLIGQALEFYDFTLCGVFIVILGRNFFPAENEFAALLGGIFAFSAAFWTRPLGALLFGYIGDKHGRKQALTLSILLMGLPTLIIGLLPSYTTIGLAAPCILLCCRLIQGLSAGGEYNGAAIFALEHMKAKPGMISGLISASCVMGAVSATFIAYIVTNFLHFEQAWRIPFYLGACVAVIGFILRKKAMETEDFMKRKPIRGLPILEIIKKYPKQYILAITAGAFNGILIYTLFGFLNLYVIQYLNIKLEVSLFYNVFGMLAFMLSCPIFGRMSDKITPHNSMILASIITIFSSWLGFILLQERATEELILGQIFIGIGVGSFVGPSHIFLQQQFWPEVRYTGVASGFSMGMALTGGTTALIMTYILKETHVLLAPAMYITAASVLWLLLFPILSVKREKESFLEKLGIRKEDEGLEEASSV
ncbi:MAG: MFS transporter [Pseudomonadota bacterium]|jgi:MHS family proline/betaine transporter-like MFS transporter|nr:MFS transporter [Alphaproteobacteria bacterium]